jgi:DNA-binding response OmpR family regulator
MPLAKCPCCGGPLGENQIAIDLTSNTLAAGWLKKPIKLMPTCAELAYALIERMPEAVLIPDLASSIWGTKSPDSALGLIRNNVMRLRKSLLGAGLEIINSRGAYKLQRVGDAS